MKLRQVPKRHNNGSDLIKDKLQNSNQRMGSVRFGASFRSVSASDSRVHTYDVMEVKSDENTTSLIT